MRYSLAFHQVNLVYLHGLLHIQVTQGNKIFLKNTCLGNADGQLSKVLVVVAVKEMPEDAFFVQLVKGLSFFRDVGRVVYLMFVKKLVAVLPRTSASTRALSSRRSALLTKVTKPWSLRR